MALLIGVSGLSGAGKTTAVTHLEGLSSGQAIYLGGMVLEEVEARGLSPSSENEQAIRDEIRRQHGPAALAVLARARVEGHLKSGVNVIVDAIFVIEEYRNLQRCNGNFNSVLLAIEASFETRCHRVRSRDQRRLTRQELKVRDEYEIATLRTGEVIAEADCTIVNEGSIQAFQEDLKRFWKIS